MLEKLYYDLKNPAGLASEKKLVTEAKKFGFSKDDVHKWLQEQDTYTLHKPVRRNYRRSRYYLLAIGDLYQADLADMSSLARWNGGVKYLLVLIDCFSKFLWIFPAKQKTASEIHSILKTFFARNPRPKNFMTDRGGEFVNAKLERLCKSLGINFYTAENPDTKCAFAERVIRTIKAKMYRYITHKQTWKYIDQLPAIVNTYNNTIHRSIKMKPADVNPSNEAKLRTLLNPKIKLTAAKFKLGDTVRISRLKRTFEKGYTPNWSEEIFTIEKVIKSDPVRYKIKDYNGETLLGSFYGKELQKVASKEIFKIEKVLKKRKNKWLVKWKGYPTNMASWLNPKDVMNINTS